MTTRIRIGDIFAINLDAQSIRYMQYVADDDSQLRSNVVCVFQRVFPAGAAIDPEQLVLGEVYFHAHVFLRIGLRQKRWYKTGHAQARDASTVLFRDTNDFGHPAVTVSKNWYVWRIGEAFTKVGELAPSIHHAEVGVVVPPDSLVHRARTGTYDFVYPSF